MSDQDLQFIKNRLIIDFCKGEKSVFDQLMSRCVENFVQSTKQFTNEVSNSCIQLIQENSLKTQEQIKIAHELFRTYTTERGHAKHSQKILYGVLRIYSQRVLQRRYLRILQNICKYKAYLKRMTKFSRKYYSLRIPRILLKSWHQQTRQSIRIEIKQLVNKKTDVEIQKMQKEYETIISQLQGLLEKRLIDLKVEEEQHRELVQRYEALTEKKGTQSQFSRH